MQARDKQVIPASLSSRPGPVFDLRVRVSDGIRGLSRLCNVLAVFEVEPQAVVATATNRGLEVSLAMAAEGQAVVRAVKRLSNTVCVLEMQLSLRTAEGVAFLQSDDDVAALLARDPLSLSCE